MTNFTAWIWLGQHNKITISLLYPTTIEIWFQIKIMILTICQWLLSVHWWWKKILKIFIQLINPSTNSQQWGHEWWLKGPNSVSQLIRRTHQIYRLLRLFKDLKKMFMIKDFTKSLLTNLIYNETKEEAILIKTSWMKRKICNKTIIIKQ
jgi:hypothetical protein